LRLCLLRIVGIAVVLGSPACLAADWPMWRYDAGRTAASPEELPADLDVVWSRQLPQPVAAWPDQPRLDFDATYQPVVYQGLLLVPSMVRDSLTAYRADTGDEAWRFYAEGPVRFAPACGLGRVYVASDDGFLYCLEASTGELIWKLRGGPDARCVLGNERLVSAWPIRGAPVLVGDAVYFAAGIWPFMGVFLYAVDAESGAVRWCNSGSGSIYTTQPHNSPAFAGIAPQGYLAVTGDHLIIPNGRSVPGSARLSTGDLEYLWLDKTFPTGLGTKRSGSYHAAAIGDWFLNFSPDNATASSAFLPALYRADDGEALFPLASKPVLTDETLFGVEPVKEGGHALVALALPPRIDVSENDRGERREEVSMARRWSIPVEATPDACTIRAGQSLFIAGASAILRVDTTPAGGALLSEWRGATAVRAESLLAADGRLFAVTTDGRILCFGSQAGGAPPREWRDAPEPAPSVAEAPIPGPIPSEGYALVLGLDTPGLAETLAGGSGLRVVVIDADEGRVAAFRARMDRAGLYGQRVSARLGDPWAFPYPPYMACAVVSGSPVPDCVVPASALAALRPYGGVAYLRAEPGRGAALAASIGAAGVLGLECHTEGDLVIARRPGPLPGAGNWTHQYADAGNSVISSDALVRAPLGLLWFGGPPNTEVLPRHGHGPSPQVVGGRLFIEGPDMLRAIDIYTGRLLWQVDLPGLGTAYDETSHQPGANSLGANYVSLEDGIYLRHRAEVLRLDPADGSGIARFALGEDSQPDGLGYIGVLDDVLVVGDARTDLWSPDLSRVQIATMSEAKLAALVEAIGQWEGIELEGSSDDPIEFAVGNLNRLLGERSVSDRLPPKVREAARQADVRALEERIAEHLGDREASPDDVVLRDLNRRLVALYYPDVSYVPRDPGGWGPDGTSSRRLTAMDRHTGRVLWSRDAEQAFWHNGIALGGGKVFCIDRLPASVEDRLRRRGEEPQTQPQLLALDLRTGDLAWSDVDAVFGTWLSYQPERGVLLEAGSRGRDRSLEEIGDRMALRQGADGRLLWRREVGYAGPCMLRGDTIVAQGQLFDLATGEPRLRRHPLTDELVPFTFERQHGCNSAIGAQNLLTFRSAAAGFFDLANDGGTGNLGGFRSSCTSNLIPAGGVVCAPDYTRTCTCSYQNQTSLALVPVDDAEQWTFNPIDRGTAPIRRVGINLGAPGDRRDGDGTLWLDYPSVGGKSPDPAVSVSPESADYFRRHSSTVPGPLAWVAASGVEGLSSLRVSLGNPTPRPYTVRLVFCAPAEGAAVRRFDVLVQGQKVLEGFGAELADGDEVIVSEFAGVLIADELEVSLAASEGRTLLCGVEVVAEAE